MGSLYTSILPSLIPENIGQVVAGNTEAEKVSIPMCVSVYFAILSYIN